ncbi:MAG: replication-associated recombination protein A [Oscillospiraceae bacterium]
MSKPLADLIRPQELDEVVGQRHLLSRQGVLRKIIESKNIPNMIFFGPSGTGKTTVASIISKNCGKKLYKLNGTTASTADIKDIIDSRLSIDAQNGILLYLDEIQYLNKKQQQTLLEFIENGDITLIASTTENPYFYVYNAILSRSVVFEFKPVDGEDIIGAVVRGKELLQEQYTQEIQLEGNSLVAISYGCGGDVRKALNILDACVLSADVKDDIRYVTEEIVSAITGKSSSLYDKDGDMHYNLLSALQKSIRGSDENAALHYLARLLDAGDLISPCRRLLVIASEDIGLAYPFAAVIVKSLVDSALQLGLPEARIPLGEAAVLLATSPKSNSSYMAINEAMYDVEKGNFSDVPPTLKDAHYGGAKKLAYGLDYKYPHEYKNHFVKQEYLPTSLRGKKYYNFADNKTENAAKLYRQKILDEAK